MNPIFINIDDFPLARGLVLVKGELSGRLPLNRGKEYFPAAVRADDEINKPIAPPAHAIKKNHRFLWPWNLSLPFT